MLAAKRSGKHPGYLRLTLQDLVLPSGKRTVATTSVFAKGDGLDFRAHNAEDAPREAALFREGVGPSHQTLLHASTSNADTDLGTESSTGSDVTINSERHLTFRLTQALALRD